MSSLSPNDAERKDVEAFSEVVHCEHNGASNEFDDSNKKHNGSLVRGLKPRHVSMIAIAGSVGTGLIIGTGTGLAQAGPAPLLIAYSLVGFVVFIVMSALGEMAAWLPLPSGFTGYATRFVDPALGFALGWTYVF